MRFQCDARYVLVVEKDAIFQRLTEDRFFDMVPCVMVTGKGMPDVATRMFLRKLCDCFPWMTVLGLVDWNPSGVAILSVYKYGSHRMGLESPRYALPSLRWLGVRSPMLQHVDPAMFQPLTARDRALSRTLRSRLAHEPSWVEEICSMDETGRKAEIEAAYNVHGFDGLAAALTRSILRREYIP
ncbi:unnamed protein product [Ostreobium quekettii]|uniref:Topoisomerase 6 subunit A/Spo11 TOPRIM domain-containing protein n=1 Tax=Ostreobium quekettii TaxID=121088 RepID=A0A8S1JF14_9CHLO|nr:unnamed protein product [Ostreobium quekettii]